jgi:hypothetical protein
MTVSDITMIEPVPKMWRVLLFRISQAQERDRILRDWETNVFGYRLHEARRRQFR